MRHLAIAAGGTGGHMFPAQALAEAMLADGWRVTLSTDARGARYAGGFPDAVARRQVASATPARGGAAAKLALPVLLARGVGGATAGFRRDRPDVVVGFGGYPTIPAMAAAMALRLPRMIHEQNGVLGRVNQIFAKRVHRVACGTWPTELPAGVAGVHTGNPIRAAVRAQAGAPYPAMDGPLSLVVFGGSQGARVISDVVPGAVAALPAELRGRLRVAHQARDEDAAEVRRVYAAAGIEAEIAPFLDDMGGRLARAHLVVCRSGASSVADIAAVGRPAIFVPFAAAIRGEQLANARPMEEAGAAVVMTEDRLTPAALSDAIAGILGDPARAGRMAAAARSLGRPDAVDRLKELVVDLATARARR